MGLFALQVGSGVLDSTLWAVPSGLISMLLARQFFRFQQRDVDSTVLAKELFYARAVVTGPIARGEMGRVRVLLGQSTVDRYARAEQPEAEYAKGESVYIVRIKDDCVYVDRSDVLN